MFKEKVKELIVKEKEKGSKKKLENIVVFIVILIITVIAINSIWGENEEETKEENISGDSGKKLAAVNETNSTSNDENTMEKKLETILSNIDGVGNVKVLITYSESSEVVAMYNENNKNSVVEEKDSGGGTRTTTQTDTSKDIIYKEENGDKIPVTRKSSKPKNRRSYYNSGRSE